MKEKGIPLIVALVCFIALCAGYLLLVKYNEKQEEAQEEDVIQVLAIQSDDVASVTCTLDEQEVTFTKSEDDWTLSSDASFSVDSDQVTSLLTTISEMTANREMDQVDSLDEYGLDQPVCRMTVTDTDGNAVTISWGDTNSTTNDTYVMTSEDTTRVYTVSDGVPSLLEGSLEDFRATEETSTNEETTD